MLDFITTLPWYVVLPLYIVLAVGVVFVSEKLSTCVDNLDKLTGIGGAIIGGIFLAAVTSLPELFTSISSVVMGEPGLVFGNILGSNAFNVFILGIVDVIFVRKMFMNKVGSMKITTIFTMIMYAVLLLPIGISLIFNYNLLGLTDISLFNTINFNIVSIIIIIIYVFSIKGLAKDQKQVQELTEGEEENKYSSLSDEDRKKEVKKNILVFILFAIILVGVSIVLTKTVDTLAEQLDLGKSVAGALFLGAATSLPEMTAVISLVKLNNYDAAVGNIIGSNVFNFTILSISDLVYIKEDIFDAHLMNGSEATNVKFLALFGFLECCIALYMILRKNCKNKFVYVLPSIGIILLYVGYLLVSFLIK